MYPGNPYIMRIRQTASYSESRLLRSQGVIDRSTIFIDTSLGHVVGFDEKPF